MYQHHDVQYGYDFTSRLKYFAWITDPRTLLASDEDVNRSVALVMSARKNESPGRVRDEDGSQEEESMDEVELTAAQQLADSAVHPQTGQILPKILRRSSFLVTNLPLIGGMLFSPATPFWIVFWQWLNQTLNSAINYSNRNTSNFQSNMDLVATYILSVGVSCTTALIVKHSLPVLKANSPVMKGLFRGLPPLSAVALASPANAVLVRNDEYFNGISVSLEPYGESVGSSRTAGAKALKQTALSRMLLPVPGCLIPPIAMELITARTNLFKKAPKLRTPLYWSILAVSLSVAPSLSLAPWPWQASVKGRDLEPEFYKYDTLYFNRGL